MYDFDSLHIREDKLSEKWYMTKLQGRMCGVFPLSAADMEFKTAPEIVDAVRQVVEFGIWGYTYPDNKMKSAVVKWMKTRHNWDISPNYIVNTNGIVPALYMAIYAFTNPGDKIVVQSPVYSGFSNTITSTGRMVVENQLIEDELKYTINFEDLAIKAKTAKMIVLCSPHNPVGRVWKLSELKAIADICIKNDVLLFVDEIHADLVHWPHEFIPFGTIGEQYQGRAIVGTSPSKSFSLAGVSCASIIIQNRSLRDVFISQLVKQRGQVNNIMGVVATTAAYNFGEAWLNELLSYIKQNILYMENYLSTHLPTIKSTPIEGTYLGWLDFRELGLSGEALKQFLQEQAQLFLTGGHYFGSGGNGFMRINLACPHQVLKSSMCRLKKVVV